MHNLSMRQALSLWSEFESAFRGDNGYSGDTAEIYAYRLMPHTTACVDVLRGSGSGRTMSHEIATEVWDDAKRSLVALLAFFKEQYPKAEIEIDGYKNLDNWCITEVFNHRCHVRITNAEKVCRENEGSDLSE